MPDILIKNIGQLVGVHAPQKPLRGKELSILPSIFNAYLLVKDGRIEAFGPMEELKAQPLQAGSEFDAAGRIVLPSWCDSHTHLVFAASREEEFVQKLKGVSYVQIARSGGGILNSARKLQETPEERLYDLAWERLQEIATLGTGAVEIKSGYGLTVESELKMLRVIRKLRDRSPLTIRATFLGAHTYPEKFRNDHQGYINCIIKELLPVIRDEQLADFIDVFCEQGFFSNTEMEAIVSAGIDYGLKPKIHANQLSASGAVEKAVTLGALSVDHLEMMDDSSISALKGSSTIGTLLPTAAFFLRMPYQPARKLIEQACALAIASDYNPGSSPSGNMNFVVALSCIQMKMLPEEAINAATINGAFAMELNDELGSIARGKKANLIVTKAVPSLAYLPYSFGTNLIERVMLNGDWIVLI